MTSSLLLFLLASKHIGNFFLSFKILNGLTKDPQPRDVKNAYSALSLASSCLLETGFLLSIIQFGSIMLENTGSSESYISPSLFY